MTTQTSQLGVLDLHNDALVMILDMVPVKADLKALCLVSHAFRRLTLPYLYRSVEINSRSRPDWQRFLRSVSAGAALNLIFTKSLTIWDTQGIPAPDAEEQDELSDLEQRLVLNSILQTFQPARLQSFRFESPTLGLDTHGWTFLSRHMETLRHLHTDLTEWPHDFRPTLRTLDIKIQDEFKLQDLSFFLHKNFSRDDSTVQRLHVAFHDSTIRAPPDSGDGDICDGRLLFDNMISKRMFSLAHLRLTELSMRNLNLHPLHQSGALPQMSDLKSLSIHNCPGVNQVLSALGEVVDANSPLKHLSIEIEWKDNSLTNRFFDDCLQGIYQSCERLSSLHVSWAAFDAPGSKSLPCCTLEHLDKSGHRLRSLSFHNHTLEDDERTLTNTFVLLEVCRKCPNLEQLGIQEPESIGNGEVSMGDNRPEFDHSMSSLEHLPKLRMLHLRRMNWRELRYEEHSGRVPVQPDGEYIQETLGELFLQLSRHRSCPELRYVVFGSENHVKPHDLEDHLRPSQQHCIMQQRVIGQDGIIVPIAVPISREQMKLHDPDLDMLEHDPAPYRLIKASGRFYDD